MKRMFFRTMAGVAAMGATLLGLPAHAQDLLGERNDVAGGRAPKEYSTNGLNIGPWTLAPRIQVNSGYDSNLYGTDGGTTADGFTILAPSLQIVGHLPQLLGVAPKDNLTVSAGAKLTRYFGNPSQNTDEYSVRAGAVGELLGMTGRSSLSLSRSALRRGTNGAPLSVGPPSLYDAVTASVDLERPMGPLTLTVGSNYGTLTYTDLVAPNGNIISQAFRDSEHLGFKGRLSYLPSDIAGIALFASYERAHVPIPNNYTNETTTLGGDIAIDTGMFRLSASGGRTSRQFGNPAFRDFSGWTYSGSLDWYPTPLLTLGAQASRGLESSGVPTVGSVIGRTYGVTFDYELLRNFLIHGRIGWRRERFPEIGQSARSISREIRGEFSFNRFVAIAGYGRSECRNSSVTLTARRFCVTLTGISLTLRR